LKEYLKKTPNLGNNESNNEKIIKFYEYWENYESHRSFDYYTKYNLNDADNGRIRRLMNKENNKLKYEAKKIGKIIFIV